MGIKLEWFFVLVIAIFLSIFFIFDQNKKSIQKAKSFTPKEIEINNFIAYDINKSAIKHQIRAKNAIKQNNNWYLKDTNISSDDIKSLTSKKAIYQGDKFIFLDNVVGIKKDGTIYKSNEAIYNVKTLKFYTNKNFILEKNGSIVYGKKLFYDKKLKITKAKDINSTIKLKK